jgi:hypothetical protein
VTDYINNIVLNDIGAVESAVGTENFIFASTSQGGKVFNGTTVANISLSGDYNHAFRVNNRNLVFSGYDILVYDSTSGASTLLPVAPSYFSEPILHNEKVYFHNDGSFVYETDGTSTGTKKISSKTVGSFNFDPYLFGKDDKLYYSTNQGDNTELWEIDLTTVLDSSFSVIKPAASSIIEPFAFEAGGNLVYAKYTTSLGNELWVYNSLPTAVKDNLLQDQVNIFPNPAINEIYIHFNEEIPSGSQLFLYNAEGNCIKKQPISGKEFRLNIGEFSQGIYFMQINSDKGYFTSRFLKI